MDPSADHGKGDQSKLFATRLLVQTMTHHVTSFHAIAHLVETLIPQNYDTIIYDTGFQWPSPRGEAQILIIHRNIQRFGE
jgi:hypothetical protein